MLKYLHGFKWEDLTEKFLFERKMREQRLKAELSQAKKEVDFISDKMVWSKRLQKRLDKSAKAPAGEEAEGDKPDEAEEEKKPTEKAPGKSTAAEDEKSEKLAAKRPKKALKPGMLAKRLRMFRQRTPIRPVTEIVDEEPAAPKQD